jgi:hypothetical protein
VAIDPLQDVAHGEVLCGGGMQERGEQRAGTLGPVMLTTALPVQSAGADHRVGGDDGRIPIGSSGERRPTNALDARWAIHFSARVVEKRPPFTAARRCGGPHDIGLRRGRDNRTVGQQNIGDDQGRRLS